MISVNRQPLWENLLRSKLKPAVLAVAFGLFMATATTAQEPPTPQFAFTGFIQEAVLDTTGAICTPADPRLAGGTITVNGIRMIVPCNTILQLPAATWTWADLFDPAASTPVGNYIGAAASPVPANPVAGGVKTGLALADSPGPFPSFAVSVIGNVVGKNGVSPYPSLASLGIPDGSDRYVAALILPIEQQVLNGGSGIVSFIDYVSGAIRVGGKQNDPNCTQGGVPGGGPQCSGSLLQMNDPPIFDDAGNPVTGVDGSPSGRWGKAHSIDPRFSGDNENTTMHASTGIPVCVPRLAPPGTPGAATTGIDPECPIGNRPLNNDPRYDKDGKLVSVTGGTAGPDPFLAADAPRKIFDMPPPPGRPGADPTGYPDATKQVPIMVGDQLLWIGTQYVIDPTKARTPDNIYTSAHTIEDILGIFTAPGVPPAYVFIEGILIGAGGPPVLGIIQEATTRLFMVGFTTDPTAILEVYAQDLNPCSGRDTLRLLATTDPATQPMRGRFVHHVLGGDFGVPTRYYVIKSQTRLSTDQITANGITAGQYLLPNFEFIVPENHRLGDPILPGNFQDFPFLASGSGPLDGFGTQSAIAGQLDPWPGATPPSKPPCAGTSFLPIVDAGPDITVATGARVKISGSSTRANDSVVTSTQWIQTDGPAVALSGADTLNVTFDAPTVAPGAPPIQLTFALLVTDQYGTGKDELIVMITSEPDTVTITGVSWKSQKSKRGAAFGKLTLTASTNSTTPGVTLIAELASAANGSIIRLGTMPITAVSGEFKLRELKGIPMPSSITVRSSGGGSATVTCAVDIRSRLICQ